MTDPDDDLSLEARRDRLAAARHADRGSPEARALHLETASALIIALVDELEEAEADDLLAQLTPLMAHDAHLEIATRRHLARELTRRFEYTRAVVQLRAAHARATGVPALETELAIALSVALEQTGAGDDARRVLSSTSTLLEAAENVDDPELASAMERSLAKLATGEQAMYHARRSLDHAHETVDPQIVADAISFLCDLLVERDELVEAKALLEQRPPTRDGRTDRALYDEIRRRLGEYVPDPAEEPDEPAQLDPSVIAYLTKPFNLARSIIDGGLPSTAKVREWSAGTLREAAELESQKIFGPVRSFWCACGRFRGREYAGMWCHRCGVELVHTSCRRTRVGCIVLDAPVLHPWYAPAAGVLLDTTATEILAMPLDALRAKLQAVDIAALAARFKSEIVTAPKAKLADEAGRRLALVEAFRHAYLAYGTTPSSVLLEVILVAPPHGELGFDRTRVRDAYAAILDAPGDPRVVALLFDALAPRR